MRWSLPAHHRHARPCRPPIPPSAARRRHRAPRPPSPDSPARHEPAPRPPGSFSPPCSSGSHVANAPLLLEIGQLRPVEFFSTKGDESKLGAAHRDDVHQLKLYCTGRLLVVYRNDVGLGKVRHEQEGPV